MQGSGLITSLFVQLPGSRGSGAWAARKLLSWPVAFLSDLSCSGVFHVYGKLQLPPLEESV